MHIILEKIGAGIATMTIKNPEVTTFGPSAFVIGLGNIHYYRNSIFIVIFDHPMERIDCVALYDPIALLDELHWLDFRDVKLPPIAHHSFNMKINDNLLFNSSKFYIRSFKLN